MPSHTPYMRMRSVRVWAPFMQPETQLICNTKLVFPELGIVSMQFISTHRHDLYRLRKKRKASFFEDLTLQSACRSKD